MKRDRGTQGPKGDERGESGRWEKEAGTDRDRRADRQPDTQTTRDGRTPRRTRRGGLATFAVTGLIEFMLFFELNVFNKSKYMVGATYSSFFGLTEFEKDELDEFN